MERPVSVFTETLTAEHWSSTPASAQLSTRLATSRILALVVMTVAGVFIPDLPLRWVLVATLGVLVPLNILAERFISRGQIELFRSAHDHGVALCIAFLVPMLWATAGLIIVVNTLWWLLRPPTPPSKIVIIGSLSALIGVAVARQPLGWVPFCITALIISVQYAWLTRGMRNQIALADESFVQTLVLAKAIAFSGDPISGEMYAVRGPIRDVTGYTFEEWRTVDRMEHVHPDDRDRLRQAFKSTPVGTALEYDVRLRSKDGTYALMHTVVRIDQQSDGTLLQRGITMDISEMDEVNRKLRHQAETDDLTGLANRTTLVSDLEARLQRGQQFALVLLDLKRFKVINDALGHSVGDLVLIAMARRIEAIAGPDDLTARLAGDDFALVLSGVAQEAAAVTFAERLAGVCSEPLSVHEISVATSATIGIALAPRDGDNVETILRRAELAMYDAKRNDASCSMFNISLERGSLEDLLLSASIASAIRDGEFVLHFQPKVDLISGRVVGFEGLARWEHPTLGLLMPMQFLDLVSVGDHTRPFSDAVIRMGIAFAARCAAAGHPVPIAVNLSARSLFDDALVARIATMFDEFNVAPEFLVIEVTEHDIMRKTTRPSILTALAALGVKISIDDFGTGYSSLSRLADLPVTEIKIDRRFVSQSTCNAQDAVIVRSIIDLARNLGLDVVAEGVEQTAEVDLLVRAGCREAQGYLYSKPIAPSEALKTLDRSLQPAGLPVRPTR